MAAVARGAIAALPSDLRARAAAQNDPATVERLTEVMTAWVYGGALNQADFAERFLGRSGDDPVAGQLRAAASGAAFAKSHADLGEAASRLAKAMQAIGLDRWQRFLVDAQHRANDPATISAVNKSRQPTDLGSKDDSIRPVYPVEALAAAAVAGIAAGGAAIVRSIGGTLLRQVMPERGPGANTRSQPQKPENAAKPPSTNVADRTAPNGQRPSSPGAAFPDRALSRTEHGTPIPDPEAEGSAHTQLGKQEGRRGSYPQAREFDKRGQPVRDIDFTDHGRPGQHMNNPHQHRYLPNPTGGTPQRGPAEPME